MPAKAKRFRFLPIMFEVHIANSKDSSNSEMKHIAVIVKQLLSEIRNQRIMEALSECLHDSF